MTDAVVAPPAPSGEPQTEPQPESNPATETQPTEPEQPKTGSANWPANSAGIDEIELPTAIIQRIAKQVVRARSPSYWKFIQDFFRLKFGCSFRGNFLLVAGRHDAAEGGEAGAREGVHGVRQLPDGHVRP